MQSVQSRPGLECSMASVAEGEGRRERGKEQAREEAGILEDNHAKCPVDIHTP